MDDNANLNTLPFGLRPYQPLEFVKLHAAGSGMLTASQIPALFGHSRWGGRYAIAAHISGRLAMEGADNPMTARGRRLLEPVACDMLQEEGYHVTRPELGMWVPHPTIKNFAASPDAIAFHLEETGGQPLVGEIKVVAEAVWKERWQDGPPLEVELQHQAQLACCGKEALFGVIGALVVGQFCFDLHPYETSRNTGAIRLIEEAATALLDLLDAGEMPEPDSHESAGRVLQLLHPIDPAKEIQLTGEEAKLAAAHFDAWEEAKTRRLQAEGIEKIAKAYFMAKAKDASRIFIGNGERTVFVKDINKKAYSVAATSFRQVTPKRIGGTDQ